jgi:putative flippase GtrA
MSNSLQSLPGIALLNRQPVRYIINGLFATAIHFLVLTFNLKILGWQSAGLSNLVAAVFGIATSFLGSRYYVFNESLEPLLKQLYRFILLYVAIALLHGGLLYGWVDLYHYNYVFGFVIATVMQVVCSYFGNKVLVFKV